MLYLTGNLTEPNPEIMQYKNRISDCHVFVSSEICSVLFTEEQQRKRFKKEEEQLKETLKKVDKYVTIVQHKGQPPISLFFREVVKRQATGLLEEDALKIFESVQRIGGKPAGFIWKPDPRYQAEHPTIGRLNCHLYDPRTRTSFGPKISLDQYMMEMFKK